MIIIVIPILIAVLLGVEELLYRKYWDKNLGVSLQFDEAPVTEGDKTTLTEVVTNGKRMPVPVLEVGFSIDRGLYIENAGNTVVSDLTNAVEVFSVGGNERLQEARLLHHSEDKHCLPRYALAYDRLREPPAVYASVRLSETDQPQHARDSHGENHGGAQHAALSL